MIKRVASAIFQNMAEQRGEANKSRQLNNVGQTLPKKMWSMVVGFYNGCHVSRTFVGC